MGCCLLDEWMGGVTGRVQEWGLEEARRIRGAGGSGGWMGMCVWGLSDGGERGE